MAKLVRRHLKLASAKQVLLSRLREHCRPTFELRQSTSGKFKVEQQPERTGPDQRHFQ